MERRHDEEIQNTVLENGLHQPAHPGLAVVSFELQDEDDNTNKSDKVCRGVRVWISAGRLATNTCKSDLGPVDPRGFVRSSENTSSVRVERDLGHLNS